MPLFEYTRRALNVPPPYALPSKTPGYRDSRRLPAQRVTDYVSENASKTFYALSAGDDHMRGQIMLDKGNPLAQLQQLIRWCVNYGQMTDKRFWEQVTTMFRFLTEAEYRDLPAMKTSSTMSINGSMITARCISSRRSMVFSTGPTPSPQA